MRFGQARCACTAASVIVLSIAASSQAELIGVGSFSGGGGGSALYSVDPGTGAATLSAPIIGPSGPIAFIAGLEWDASSGSLYAYTSDASAGKLYTINPATGAAAEVGALGVSSFEGGLAFDASGTLYGIRSGAANALMTIDTSTGAATTVGPLGPFAVDISGIAFSSLGGLIGYDMRFAGPGAHHLHSIDPTTGAATFIGSTLIDVESNVGGLDFDPATDTLYLTDGFSLYTASTGSGGATLIGLHGISQMSGIAFIPEPGSALGIFAGIVTILMRRGDRR